MTRIKSSLPSLALMAVAVAISIGCASIDRPEEEAPTKLASPTAEVAEVPSVAATQPGDAIAESKPSPTADVAEVPSVAATQPGGAVVESLPTATAEVEVQSSYTPFVEKEVEREPARGSAYVTPTVPLDTAIEDRATVESASSSSEISAGRNRCSEAQPCGWVFGTNQSIWKRP